ncbi:MAG TPA: M1 family aminopeptidase [Longimicrobium sp.]
MPRLAAFEARYQLRRVSPWVFLLVLAGISFLTTSMAGGAWSAFDFNRVLWINSPAFVAAALLRASILAVPIVAGIAGTAVQRDFQTVAHPLFFTTPVRPRDYLLGRWLGAVGATLVVLTGIPLGVLAACAWPSVNPDLVGPFRPGAFLAPFAFLVVPNVLFTAALFVALALSTRRMLPVYVGGLALLVAWSIARLSLMAVDAGPAGALLDPFGNTALARATRYWTVAERNTRDVPWLGLLAANRLLWLGVGAAVLGACALHFRFRHAAEGRARAAWDPAAGAPPPPVLRVPAARRRFDAGARLLQLAGETRRALSQVVANVWFPVLVALGVLLALTIGRSTDAVYGTPTYPVTYRVLEAVQGSLTLFVIVIIAVYAGELVWNERELRAAGIHDALPVPTWLSLAARFLALLAVVAALQGVAMLCGVLLQVSRGWYRFEPGLYLSELFVYGLAGWVPVVGLALFIQALVNHKYVGHFLFLLWVVGSLVLYGLLGVEHNLALFGSAPSLTYSDLNGYGHALVSWRWFTLYWGLWTLLLAAATHLLWVRGQDAGGRWRLREARRRMTRPLLAGTALAALLVLATGGFIYYNTAVLNHFETDDEGERVQAGYEKDYKRWEWVPQPRIAGARLEVDIFAGRRDLRLRGTYRLVNRSGARIDSVHVDLLNSLQVRELRLDRPAARVVSDSARGYYVFRLARPLLPGDSAQLVFHLEHDSRGFENEPSYQPVVGNGTFFDSRWLPGIGYNPDGELDDPGAREEHHLPPRPRAARIDDPRARTRNFVARDADWMDFEVTLSTDAGQTAVAPGYLQRAWTAGGRRFFHYRMDAPILNFYAFLSARYRVRRDRWDGVSIEVYHHPGHEWNVERMVRSVQASLGYYTREFGPYQHRQVRILEFPRYGEFAQSFDNTIPYSEAIGFIADVREGDIDYPFFVTAHEVAHQWWGHQVAPADVQGAAMLSETLAEYGALMVMEREYGREQIGRFLRYEMDQYLEGRGAESRGELPLMLVENQQYIHYNKGALAMYALRDWIGEERVNGALRAFLREWRFRGPPYPTARDLVAHLRAATPDSLKHVVSDLFEHVTLYENRAVSATARELGGGRWEVSLTVQAAKLRADSLGEETPQPLGDWIDVGVYAAGDPEPLYLRKHRVTRATQTIRVVVEGRPARAGIDPLHKLIDRRIDDNVVGVTVGR